MNTRARARLSHLRAAIWFESRHDDPRLVVTDCVRALSLAPAAKYAPHLRHQIKPEPVEEQSLRKHEVVRIEEVYARCLRDRGRRNTPSTNSSINIEFAVLRPELACGFAAGLQGISVETSGADFAKYLSSTLVKV